MTDAKNLALEAKRAYQREWRRKNREKVREYNERYWIKRAKRLGPSGMEGEAMTGADEQTEH